ncbi:hypothetical protein HDE_10293 [Halotydeus destructor]|nr:hypothetical protein HDE_10293 [Halotydeus destructor]
MSFSVFGMSVYSHVEPSATMHSSSWFRYMDIIFTSCGLNVYKLPGRLSTIKLALRSTSVLYSHLLLCHSVFTYVNRMEDPYSLLFLMQLFFSVVSFQSILRNRNKVQGIVEEICRCSSQHLLTCLQNVSKVLFLLWVLVLLLQMSLLCCQWYFIGTTQWMKQVMYTFEGPVNRFHHFLVLSDIIFWVVYVIGFIVGTICVFVFLLLSLNKLYLTRIKQLTEKLDYSQTLAKNLECFREIRTKYQGLKEAANDIFGLTVCGYFAECYLETGLRLANDDNKAEKSLHSLITDWGLYGLQVLLLLTFILFLSKLSDKEENCEKRLLRKIISNKTRNYEIDYQKMMLVIEISQSPIAPVTAWSVFVINRSLLLGFLGSVIPFAVLIASLFEKTKLSPSHQCSNYTQLIDFLLKNVTSAF